MSEDFDAALEPVGEERRSFLKKMAMGGVFVVPTVASFTMTGIDAVYAQTPSSSGNGDDTGVADDSIDNTTTTEPDETTTTTEPDTTTTTQPNQTSTTLQTNQ
ncbi:hypothetical protein [Actinospongicola halichondriae]|uniref:hypothetical protein n=1 Tax=Actinospongicola halichondriae TaxID=3236844 RepID=UPI003D5708C4